jgi:hypothetical protein
MKTALLLASFALLLTSCDDSPRPPAQPTQASAPQNEAAVELGELKESYRRDPARASLPPPPREAVKPARIIAVRTGEFAKWSYEDYLEPVGYRMGDATLIVRGPAFPKDRDVVKGMPYEITRQIRIQAPGMPDYVQEDESITPWQEYLIGYGRFDRRGTPFVMMQTRTGGSQCCLEITLFILHPGRTEHVELGDWSGLRVAEAPRDHDGDDLVDFVVTDDSFGSVFAPHIDSRYPPMILDVVDGKVVDVSTRPGFRPVFARAARSLRRECTHAEDRLAQDGACAAYVAAAARAGNFRKAWAEMLATYRHRNRVLNIYGQPSDVEDEQYAEKLEGFLQKNGYLAG